MKSSAPARQTEGRLALAIAALALLLTSGPRLFLYLTTPPGQVFLGQVWGPHDIPPYVLLVRQAAAGAWLFDDRMQGPGHTAFLLYTPYLVLGHLLGWTGLAPLAMMEAGRWIAFPIALAAGWLFVRRALPTGQRAIGYFAAVIAGGLGFLVLTRPATPLGIIEPLDLAGPSFTVMNSLNMAPHIALGVAGLALFFWGLLAAADGEWRGLLGGLALGAVASFHSYLIPCSLLAGGLFFLWRGRRRQVFWLLVLATLLAVPFGLYQLSLSSVFNVAWNRDYAELENLPSLLASRALLWPFVGIGAWVALRDPERRTGPALALCWAGCALAFDLFPPFAATELHRTVEGSPLAYGVVAAAGIARLPVRARAYLVAAMLVSPFAEAAFLVAAGPYQAAGYLPAGYVQVAQRLEAAGDSRCVVGADLTMLWVAALSHACDAQRDSVVVPALLGNLAGAGPDRAAALLPQPDDLVIWGPSEAAYGPPPSLPVVGRARATVLLSG